jgi:hypothetical protein
MRTYKSCQAEKVTQKDADRLWAKVDALDEGTAKVLADWLRVVDRELEAAVFAVTVLRHRRRALLADTRRAGIRVSKATDTSATNAGKETATKQKRRRAASGKGLKIRNLGTMASAPTVRIANRGLVSVAPAIIKA